MSKATQMTKPALIIMFRNKIFEIGEHHGINSVGTQTLKILTRKIMTVANIRIVRAQILYLIIRIERSS